jgi:hypothetical protein
VIERPKDKVGALLAKCSVPVTAGAELVVADGESAVFARGAQSIRVIGPGRYPVPAEFAGDRIVAFFVSTAPVTVRYGGRGATGQVFGEASVQASNPCALVEQYPVFGDGDGPVQWVRQMLQRAATDAMAVSGGAPEAIAQAIREKGPELEKLGLTLASVGTPMVR